MASHEQSAIIIPPIYTRPTDIAGARTRTVVETLFVSFFLSRSAWTLGPSFYLFFIYCSSASNLFFFSFHSNAPQQQQQQQTKRPSIFLAVYSPDARTVAHGAN